MRFIKTAYLPQNKVNTIIAGNGIIPFKNELLNLGVKVLTSSKNNKVSACVASHADLVINYLGKGKFLLENTQKELKMQLEKLDAECKVICESLSEKYPYDCLLNCIVSDNSIICNNKFISDDLANYAEKYKLKILNTNQGYTKCSVCVVSENAYITDDPGIKSLLTENGFDVLLVKKGSVKLDGYNYGFIGGCCGKISDKTIAFCGNIKKHSDYENIKAFSDNYNTELLSLSDDELTDIGSIIPIIENEV